MKDNCCASVGLEGPFMFGKVEITSSAVVRLMTDPEARECARTRSRKSQTPLWPLVLLHLSSHLLDFAGRRRPAADGRKCYVFGVTWFGRASLACVAGSAARFPIAHKKPTSRLTRSLAQKQRLCAAEQ